MGDPGLLGKAVSHDEGTARLPRICFVAPKAWPVLSGDTSIEVVGGAEVQQGILARLLARAGYPVSMVCLDYGQPSRAVVNDVAVYKAHRPEAGIPVLRFIHPRLTGMWRAMEKAGADIYYQGSPGLLTALVAAFCRHHHKISIYAGTSDHDFLAGREDIRHRRDRWLFEHGLTSIDQVVVQNEKQRRDCLVHYGRQATLIPGCYELPPDARPGAGICVLWVGTMHRDKRPELFLELVRRLPQFRFIMVGGPGAARGDAGYFELIRNTAKAFPNLEFTGFLPLPQVEACFDRAAILVNTSTHEGIPNTFLQAWARGVPTVALVDIEARLLGTPVCNTARSLTDATTQIKRLMTDDLYRRRATTRCREYFINTHGSAGVLPHYTRLFDKLASG